MGNIYKGSDGSYYTEYELAKIYRFNTGKKREDSESNFIQWIKNRKRDKKIIGVFNQNSMEITDELILDNIVLAITCYRKQNGCSLAEAKAIIEEKCRILRKLEA